LSPQEYIDCSGNFGNAGCGGGYVTGSLQYSTYYGLAYDRNYPYTDRQGPCQGTTGQFVPSSYYVIPQGNNDMIQQALNNQPLSVALDASQLQFYSSGIYNGPCSTSRITHFMTLIGYGSHMGTNYWRLENSWGTNWGQLGYMFMQKYSGFGSAPCGLPNQVTYPTA
jgi:C1A family cysteine protease